MDGFIYKICNNINNKIYIGQTKVDVEFRWKEHLRHCKYGNLLLYKAMRKYGSENFSIETIDICNINDIDEKEIYYINFYDSTNRSKGYNISLGGKTPKFLRPQFDSNELIDLYNNKKLTLEEICNIYKTTRYIITTELKRSNVSIRKRSASSSRFNKISKEKLLESLNCSNSLRSAAKYCNMNYTTFRKACIANSIEYNSSKSPQHRLGENIC